MAKSSRAFTLIEILVVFGIVITLAGVIFTAMDPVGQLKKSRDARRRSDLNQYREGLESFAAVHNSLFPDTTAGDCGAGSCDGNSFDDTGIFAAAASSPLVDEYLSAHLEDPVNDADYHYRFYGDNLGYKLFARLEAGSGGYWVICSDGRSGDIASAPSASKSCDL